VGQSVVRRHTYLRIIALVLVALSSAACGEDHRTRASEAESAPRSIEHSPSPIDSTDDQRPRIVALGDSLTAGLGLDPRDAYPAVLQKRIDGEGWRYRVINAGVSGDTSAGGLRRADWALEGDVRILIIALGGNDALRGLPPEALKRNIGDIIERAQKRGINVALAGMEAPPELGPAYAAAFHRVYGDLARQYHVAFVPFLLQGVAGNEELNQPDRIHPTAAGARILADNVWTVLRPLLKERS